MAFASDPLKPFQWKFRLVVVSAPVATDPALVAQLRLLAHDPEGQADRDLKLIRLVGREGDGVDAQALRERLSMAPDRFELVLVGLDGTIALRRRQPLMLEELFARIDSMPMRREQLRLRAETDPKGR
jgi:hypothetical protein